MAAPEPTTSRPRKGCRRVLVALLVVVLVLALAVAYAWLLSGRRPAWWHDVAADPPTQARAEQVENTVVSELSRARPAETPGPYRSREWTLEITQDQANAWLATRLKAWALNRGGDWPAAIESVQVSFQPGRVAAGVHLVQHDVNRVISITGLPEIRDGAAWLRISGMAVGGLPLPRGLILDQFGSLVRGSSAEEILDALDGKRPILDEPIIKLDGGRRVRMTGVRAEAGRLIITCRTEKD